ncbi:MAG: sensor histidine kinase KdpD, partial [Christensenella sp.]|uniref:sensor histidine kinase KdpD n=1 Tax=Christensenella sp. TaxID=1935934 RepID=UPI002B21B4F2
IFFGYAAGVGKTYAMLEAAHDAKKRGVDVVVGYVEPHTRPETLALVEGLEVLPPLEVPYKGITLREFDLDAALARDPQLVLVDELAHSNAHGLRHTKRWGDIEELLHAGIDVYTTINVQHIESLNDIVASITHVIVRERIPDKVFDMADEVEIIDIEPSVLLERLNEGKIYRQKQAHEALEHFFIRENLMALREIALRRVADRVNQKNESVLAREHILVCLSTSPSNAKVIRTAARMAEVFHAGFTALFVDAPENPALDTEGAKNLRDNIRLAKELGAKIATTYGENVPLQISAFARVSGVTKIVIGRTGQKMPFFGRRKNFVDQLIDHAPELEVFVIPDSGAKDYKPRRRLGWGKFRFSLRDFVKMLLIMAAAVLIGILFDRIGFSQANVIVVLILGVLITANQTRGRFYGVIASVIGVLLYNFFFTEPRLTFNAYGAEYPITFAIMLVAALITSGLTSKVKRQATAATLSAFRTNILLEADRNLQDAKTKEEIVERSLYEISRFARRPVVIYLADKGDAASAFAVNEKGEEQKQAAFLNEDERAVAAWCIRNRHSAGKGTNTLPGAAARYTPLTTKEGVLAVVGLVADGEEQLDSMQDSLLYALYAQITSALERYLLNEAQRKAEMQAESERFRSNLLRAVSHDLRTPLTSISGSANSILTNKFDEETRNRLITGIYDDSVWLINLVENLLSVSRIDNDNVQLRKEPQLVSEIIEEALRHVSRKISEHHLLTHLQDDMMMVNVDVQLIVQVFINIIDNAVKYTDAGSTIEVLVTRKGDEALVRIGDDGKGISDRDKKNIFDMFYTVSGNRGDSRRGLGLGLALCKIIVEAHGGKIAVMDNSPVHGTVFEFTLPIAEVKNSENFNHDR